MGSYHYIMNLPGFRICLIILDLLRMPHKTVVRPVTILGAGRTQTLLMNDYEKKKITKSLELGMWPDLINFLTQ